MNKTNKFLALGFALVSVLFISSCVEDDDFATPDLSVTPVNLALLGEETTFSNVVARYNTAVANGDQVGVFSVENDRPLYITGYVVSDDGAGNFFEEIVVQNSTDASDPSNDVRRGFKVEINARDLGGYYSYGRKVYIKLNGLAIGLSNGVFALGKANGNSLVQLEDAEYRKFVLRDPQTATITPKMMAIEDLTEMDENTLVQFGNSQFTKNQRMLDYSGQPTDNFDGFRTVTNCDTDASITLQTSTFADFKSVILPQGKGTISGIYSRDFRDDFDVLVINSPENVNFNDPNVCDPVLLECTGANGGSTVVYSEDFESFGGYTAEGWTMTNVDGGSVDWFTSSFRGNTYSRISAFGSGEADAEVWLVTPDINLDASTGEQLNFDAEAAFINQEILSVFVSEDFTGDVTTASWTQVDANIVSVFSGNFSGLQAAGPINISCLDGSVNFAFVYKGSDPSATTRYHVDNIEITAN